MNLFYLYYIFINMIAFIIFYVDKQKAIAKAWRIPEATLLGTCLIGGALGGYISMYTFHHKTRKPKFFIGVPAMLIVQIGIYYLYYGK